MCVPQFGGQCAGEVHSMTSDAKCGGCSPHCQADAANACLPGCQCGHPLTANNNQFLFTTLSRQAYVSMIRNARYTLAKEGQEEVMWLNQYLMFPLARQVGWWAMGACLDSVLLSPLTKVIAKESDSGNRRKRTS